MIYDACLKEIDDSDESLSEDCLFLDSFYNEIGVLSSAKFWGMSNNFIHLDIIESNN